MEQTIDTVQAFLMKVDRLIVREIHKPAIKKSSVEKLRRMRRKLERIEEPLRAMSLKLLDEVLDFAHALNADGNELARKYVQKAFATLDEIYLTLDEVITYGV